MTVARYLKSNAEVWNQYSKNGNFADGTKYWSAHGGGAITAQNNILTYLVTYLTGNYTQGCGQFAWSSPSAGIPIIANHVYFNSIEFKSTKPLRIDLNGDANTVGGVNASIRLTPDNWFKYSSIKKAYTSYSSANKYYSLMSDSTYQLQIGDSLNIRNSVYVDLTAMYGAEIAEYFLTLEQNQPGSGVRLFKLLNPLPYYHDSTRKNYDD